MPFPATYWQLGAKRIELTRPRIMAIVNATPDSFYAGSRLLSEGTGMREALQALILQGPDIIDIGGQSTRPGSERVGADIELTRIMPAVELVRELAPDIPLTVDTYHSSVAQAALKAGADGVNDVSGGRFDTEMVPLVAEHGAGYVLMHMLGTPETMQAEPSYQDCVAEVGSWLADRLSELAQAGLPCERVAVDPGIGFGKRLADNLALINGATKLHALAAPIIYGLSRKSFIHQIADVPDAAARLPGTLGCTWELLNHSVMLHRLHDVAEARQLCNVWESLQTS